MGESDFDNPSWAIVDDWIQYGDDATTVDLPRPLPTGHPTLGFLAALFLAMPWLAIAFNRYCDAVTGLVSRRRAR
ncbi:hypothetical protein SAM23877_0283 [Streptomyces ambofaciens ATCC 23877]|uniref:Uncharacterized protein SAML0243 n=1 Tax=Streptomyces ambofaciens (strain ATCC 23877 / 3486 / DSM 40053 / JCM 4204 / NBRC 12836 / NRRL B-2516) TaxID=278992 RepID=Q1RRB6_STRA7|nr:hypothetical protein [Streptomyces ambofaciens]AKZ53332.1 hypothetical protein SAM23877_0283 [Streptomyces ambofaciens ATCC 23877]CAI78172.1 unknown hypothetical protein [Streptomyces ambofaciens ATCC 23877]CAJ89230.1 hypothetical protein SAML0243 [Streptomyces ambofaciens ATCC 23877]